MFRRHSAKSTSSRHSAAGSCAAGRRGIGGFVSRLRHRAQRREADFAASHPSPNVQVTAGFATLNGAVRPGVAQDSGKKKGFLRRASSQWWDRLLGAVSERSFAAQAEQYAAHQTKRDYLFNTVGHTVWGMVFPLLTIIVTQLADVERAGMFSFAFVFGTLMMIAAQYGVRTYQVSDLDEEHSFADYQVNRVITIILVVAFGYLFIRMRNYDMNMARILAGVLGYRCVDALADCYEGRLQQMDKMYLAGISQMIRAILGFFAFAIVLSISRNVGAASIAMAVAAGVSFVLLTFPLALLETPKARRMSFSSVGSLFRQCFPIFVALFLYAIVDNTPKFVMELALPYENQLYFNALYFPAQSILLIVGLIYKPQLVRMAAAWADRSKRKRFDIFIVVMLLAIVAITMLMALFMRMAGVAILGLLYGIDFERFRMLSYLMIVAGGLTGGIDFLYQVITIMRRQELVTRSYLIVFAIGMVSSILLIHFGQLEGAVTSYLLVMVVLFAALLWVYVAERINIARHPERDMALLLPAAGQTSGVNPALSGYGTIVSGEAGGHVAHPDHVVHDPAAFAPPSSGCAEAQHVSSRPVIVSSVISSNRIDARCEDPSALASSGDDGRMAYGFGEAPDCDDEKARVVERAAARKAIIAEEISTLNSIFAGVGESHDGRAMSEDSDNDEGGARAPLDSNDEAPRDALEGDENDER